MAAIIIAPNNTSGGANPVACNAVTRDAQTEYMQLMNIADPVTANCAPVDPTNGLAVQVMAGIGPGRNGTSTGQFVPTADTSAPINCPAPVSPATQTTTQIVAGVASKQVWICSYSFVSNGPGTIQFFSGPNNTTLTAMSGAIPVTAQTGDSQGSGFGMIMVAPAGMNVYIQVTATGSTPYTTNAQGAVSYAIF